MARKFKTVDYERSGQQTLTVDDCLPADHLASLLHEDFSICYQYLPIGTTRAQPPTPHVRA